MRPTAMVLLLAGASAWLLPPVGTPRQRASHPSMSASEKTGRDAAVEKYGEEAALENHRRGMAAAAANAGGQSAFSQLGRDALLEKYGEEGMREMSRQGHATAAAKFGGAVELARVGRAAAVAKHPRGEAGYAMGAGLAAARAAGKYTRYPGVRWRKDNSKWRVQFTSGGRKLSIGQYATEDEAARAHDDYVREHGLDRPLHFPRPGEWGSQQ